MSKSKWAARSATLALCALTLSSCYMTNEELRIKSTRFAERAQMKSLALSAGPYTIQAYERITQPNEPIRVFIEGDGRAWLTKTQPSPDPTPYEPTALFLASADNSHNVGYLARPCQFLSAPACTIPAWTSQQYSETNIAAMNTALDHWRGHKIELVGYSGGAGIALLLAARRNDIISIRTVAGNTDTLAFTKYHHVSPPPAESLNPASYIAKTSSIPQIHFIGAEDTTVPMAFAESYQSKLPPGNCSKIISIPNTDHIKGWAEHWLLMNSRLLPCTAPKSYYQ